MGALTNATGSTTASRLVRQTGKHGHGEHLAQTHFKSPTKYAGATLNLWLDASGLTSAGSTWARQKWKRK